MLAGRSAMLLRPFVITASLFCLAGSAAAQERQWSLDASDQDAYLIFGVPDSDDVGISLWCPIRQGVVNIFLPDVGSAPASGKDMTLQVSVDGQSADVTGKTEENADSGGSSIEVQMAADAPVFTAMLKADRFHVKVGSEESVFPLIEADLQSLIDLCKKI
jgi:hypothetical protein